MQLIRVREKNQVTLPREIMESLHLQSPGHLQYTILNDGVLIRPVSATQESKMAKIRRLAQSAPSAYGTMAEADALIKQQRDAWQK
jgi:antitoxin component of MazEF toxin-antitoxin module